MKRTLAFAIAVLLCLPVRAQQKDGVVKSGLDISALPESLKEILPAAAADVQLRGTMAERVHQSAGAGIRLIVNENLVVACDRGFPLNKQDGDSPALYITLDYLF